MPARKKDPSTRARRNKASTAATLKRAETTAVDAADDYSAMTVAQLRAEIDVRNIGRPADAQLPKRGTKAVLVERLIADDSPVPAIPTRDQPWHAQTLAWWNDVWTSPMAKEWDASDIHNVFVVALLYDDIWTADTPKARKDALGEYRLQRADLGLSPYARRRLEWTIETATEATERGRKRREAQRTKPEPAKGQEKKRDPRAILHAVS